jgi:hypothetical protein
MLSIACLIGKRKRLGLFSNALLFIFLVLRADALRRRRELRRDGEVDEDGPALEIVAPGEDSQSPHKKLDY